MKLNYSLLGKYIRQIDIRNNSGSEENLLGVSTQKKFIKSIANTVGTDFKKYKIIKKKQFAYVPDTSRRGEKIGIAMLSDEDEALVSQAYTVFEVIDENSLLPEYLMMWFSRPEFDRYARYMSHGSVREIFSWEEMCNVKLPVPTIEKQKEIVREYNTILNRIELNKNMIDKLEGLAQSIYKQWFEELNYFNYNLEYSQIMEANIPKNWDVIRLGDLCDIKGGKRLPKGKELNDNSGNPYIKVANMNNNKIINIDNSFQFVDKDTQKSISRYIVSENDIIISIVGTIGLVNIVGRELEGANLTENCAKLTNISRITPDYLYHYLKSYRGRKNIETKVVGGVQGKLPLYNIAEILIVVPDDVILNEFDKHILKINKFILNYMRQIVQLKSISEMLLKRISICEGGIDE